MKVFRNYLLLIYSNPIYVVYSKRFDNLLLDYFSSQMNLNINYISGSYVEMRLLGHSSD